MTIRVVGTKPGELVGKRPARSAEVEFLDQPVNRPCLNCNGMITKPIRWYRSEKPGDPCENYGQPIYIMVEGDTPIPATDQPLAD